MRNAAWSQRKFAESARRSAVPSKSVDKTGMWTLNRAMFKRLLLPRIGLFAIQIAAVLAANAADTKPLRALLITGGCCHDYAHQKTIISEGITARANVEWTIIHEGGNSTKHRVSIYEKPGWAAGYDIVVHNECFADIDDVEFVENVLKPHREGTPAVVIHCQMHTFRALKTNIWREFLGVTSVRHGPQHPLEVKNLQPANPIMKDFPPMWTTGPEELYAIDKLWPNATALAQAYALDNKKDHPVIWINTYGKGRVFGTTLAHNNVTMQHTNYLNVLARGLLWACDKLDDQGNPKPGFTPAQR
jgi:type 1 glutamine amidotransferase